jgi:hypothetical protein
MGRRRRTLIRTKEVLIEGGLHAADGLLQSSVEVPFRELTDNLPLGFF